MPMIEEPSTVVPGGDEPGGILGVQYVLIICAVFFYFLNFHSFVLFPIFIKGLGGSESEIGVIMGVAWLTTILTTPLAGMLIDRYGMKWFFVLGGVLMSLATFPLAFTSSIGPELHLLRIAQGVSFSLCFTAAGTLCVAVTPPARRSQALGIYGIFTIINYALAPFIGKRVIEHLGFTEFFIIFALLGMLAPLIGLLIKEPPRRGGEGGASPAGFLATLGRPGVLAAAVTLCVMGSGFLTTVSFLPVFSREIGIRDYDVFFLAYTLSVVGVRVVGGWIPDRFGRKKAAVPSSALMGLSVLGIALCNSTSGLLLTGILFGLSHGILYPAIYALTMGLVRSNEIGRAFAVCSMAFTMGGMLGLFGFGYVAELFGFRHMYMISGIVCLLGFGFFWAFGREGQSRSQLHETEGGNDQRKRRA